MNTKTILMGIVMILAFITIGSIIASEFSEYRALPKEKQIIVDIDEQTLTLREGRRETTYPITSGSVDSPTQRGEFEIINKLEDVSSYHGYTFPLWLGIYDVGEYQNGIHSVQGTNPWDRDISRRNNTPGSIILHNKPMTEVYEFAQEGTTLIIK